MRSIRQRPGAGEGVDGGKGDGVEKADAPITAQPGIEVGHQGHQERGPQLDEALRAHQGGKPAVQAAASRTRGHPQGDTSG